MYLLRIGEIKKYFKNINLLEKLKNNYKELLKANHPDNGGNLALGLVAYINDGHKDVPMPGHIIAISPGTCVNSEDEWHRMLELKKKISLFQHHI